MSQDRHLLVEKSIKKIMLNNFVGGIAWGLGVTIGASVLLAILGYFASNIGLIPVFGKFISDLLVFLGENPHQVR